MNPVIVTVLGSRGPYVGSDELPSIAVRLGKKVVLLDAGEGVQHRLLKAGISVSKVALVLITHLHGDHVLGLLPLIQSRSLSNVRSELIIVGPRGIKEYLSRNFELLLFTPSYRINIIELTSSGVIEPLRNTEIHYFELDHTVPALGYILIFKEGRKEIKISYVTDTRPIDLPTQVTGSHLLIHDSTFLSRDREIAYDYGHSTAADAARAAISYDVNELLLFHMSPRYDDLKMFSCEARRIFPNAFVAEKFMKIMLKPG